MNQFCSVDSGLANAACRNLALIGDYRQQRGTMVAHPPPFSPCMNLAVASVRRVA
ncbi:MAG: hypothetical protein JNJ94_07810 [Chlorobi bacterium]|nr:hypothetical protein [Chlorobiota bacterium]